MTRPALLVPVSVRIAAVAAALLALALVLACGDAEEQLAPETPSTTPNASAAPSPTQSASPAVNETAAPTATPSVPEDWPTFTDPGGLFTLRYPPNWFEIASDLYSSDPRKTDVPGYGLPAEIVKVEVTYYEAVGSSGCGGALLVDPKSGEGSPEPGATETTLGGIPAWEVVRLPGDPAIEGRLTRIHGISTIHQGYCFLISAYFTQQNPDVAVFLQIASSFEFKPVGG